MQLFDSHCHLDDEKFEQDRQQLIKDIFSSKVTKLISAGYSIKSSNRTCK